jgi:threonine dehydrogenase-like Zn-dependent dehydrogenase
VIVADIRDERLASIAAFGADVTLNSAKCDLKAEIMRLTDGRGVDVVITAASVAALQTLALELAAIHGRVCFFGGLPQGAKVLLDTNLVHYRGLKLLGTTGSSNEDYYKTLHLIADGRVPVKRLISQTFPLSDINAAFDYALSGQGLKTLVANT